MMTSTDTATSPPPTPRDLERFNAKVRRTESCWEWTASKFPDGYGRFRYRGSTMLAHRVAWFFQYGEFPGDFLVCHHCDNRVCVNPDHLFLGTKQDNSDDMVAKGRAWNPVGERNGNAKLTQDQVDLIRSGFFGDMPYWAIGVQLGVSENHIGRIRRRDVWSNENGGVLFSISYHCPACDGRCRPNNPFCPTCGQGIRKAA